MKRCLFVLASVLVIFNVAAVGAQSAPPGPSFDGAIAKLFGNNNAFSATIEFHYSQSSGNEMVMPCKITHSVDKSRFDMDMSKFQSGNIPPQAIAQMKQMGLGKIITITHRAKKLTYVIYPDIKAYVENATEEASADPSNYRAEATRLGGETIDGHSCIKNKVVVTGPDGVAHESIVWNASDLKQFPVKIQTRSEKGVPMVMFFKEVKLVKPDAAQFDLPAGLRKYDNMMSLMMSRAALKR
jgi:hypothetical protein